jgi:ABC-type nitrate/sulfonate/bicarbonate transport system substrate-binding protein
VVTSEETLTARADLVTALLPVIREGYLAAAADQARAVDILVDEYPETERAVEERGIALLAELWTQPEPGFGVLDPAAWADFAGWMIEHDLLPASFTIEGAIGANATPAAPGTPGP